MNNYFKNKKLQQFFEGSKEIQFKNKVHLPNNKGFIYAPTAGFNRIYILLHIYRHLFDEGIGLRQLVNYYYILKQECTNIEKIKSRQTIERLDIKKFCSAVMYIMQEIFGLGKEFLIFFPPPKRGGGEEIPFKGNFKSRTFWKMEQTYYPSKKNETHIHKYFRKIKRNLRFINSIPVK